jgi:hypothetical protein
LAIGVLALTAPSAFALPQTNIDSGPSGFVNSTSASFDFSATGASGGLRFECSLDGASFTACSSPTTYNSLAETSHTFQVQAFDTSGADPTPASAAWTVDVTPPDTSVTDGPPGLSGTSAAWEFTSTQAGSTFQCSLDGLTFGACTSPKQYTQLAQGLHIFQVKATDPAGNQDTSPALGIWTADATAADTTITSAPSGVIGSPAANIAFTSPESGVTFTCSLDGAASAPCSSPHALSGLSDGSHTIAVQAVDAFGNVDPTPASATWTVDTSPPDTVLTGNPPVETKTGISFGFSSQPGATFECRIDGGPFAACTSPKEFASLPEGFHTFEVRALDAASPDPTPAVHTWRLDQSNPIEPNVIVSESGPRMAARAAPAAPPSGSLDANHPEIPAQAFKVQSRFALIPRLTAAWSAEDPAGGTIASYRVESAKSDIPSSGSAGEFHNGVVFAQTTATSAAQQPAQAGRTHCFIVWAKDSVGRESSAGASCVTMPIKASSMQHSPSFKSKKGSGHYLNRYMQGESGNLTYFKHRVADGGWGTKYGGILVERAILVATKCPGCGKVKVALTMKWGGDNPQTVTRSKTVNLSASSTRKRQKISLWTFPEAVWRSNLRFTVDVVSSGKPVKIEGVGLSPL